MSLAIVFGWSVAPWAFEPLTEEELDRTVASGLEAAPKSDFPQTVQYPAAAAEDLDEELSDSEEEVTLVAYRQALPIVMSRMTNSNRGPLGRHGNYSLAPVSATRAQKAPAGAPVLRLGPFPAPNLPLFLTR